jgi:hypothetical protein
VLEFRSTDKIDRRVINVSFGRKVERDPYDNNPTAQGERTFSLPAIEIIPADPAHGPFSAQVLNEESETRA